LAKAISGTTGDRRSAREDHAPHGQHAQGPLDAVARRQDCILLLRYVGRELMSVSRNPVLAAAELEAVIEERMVVKARVLRSINSDAYANQSGVVDLEGAIARSGYDRIRDLAVVAAVSDLFRPDRTVGPYRRWQLWQHAARVGTCARLLARRRQLPLAEWAFAAGFLHDIGLVLQDLCLHERYDELMQSLDVGKSLIENERNWLGTDHTEVGQLVADHCEFHPAVRDAIRWHHASEQYKGTHVGIVRCVEAANVICAMQGAPSIGLRLLKMPRDALSDLKLTSQEIRSLAVDVERESARYETLLDI
jgi:HD-like signal output (HDOD) protein